MGLSSSPGGFLPSEQIADGTTAGITWLNGKTDLRQSGALTANRSTTLPAAKAFPPGTSITFIDGFTTGSFGRSFSPAGADTLNGDSSALTFFIGPGTVEFETDGVSKWTQLYANSSIVEIEDFIDRTKAATFDASNIPTSTTRVISVAPTADSTTVIPSAAPAGSFVSSVSSSPSTLGELGFTALGTVQVNNFTTNGTYTKPDGAKMVYIIAIGGGGGGGSGRQGPAGSLRTGGSGGSHGAYAEGWFDPGTLGPTATVTIGAGGAGGASQASAGTNGIAGANGETSSFGTVLFALGGLGGLQGSGSSSSGSAQSFSMRPATAGGGGGNTNGNPPDDGFGGSGGGGAAITAADAVGAGGDGGGAYKFATPGFNTGGAGGTSGGSGTPGTAAVTNSPYFGSGGGGGAATNSAVGGSGAAGGKYGAGGGGGAASLNTFASGAGGAGGNGIVVVYTVLQ